MKDSEGNWLEIGDVVEYWVAVKPKLESSRMGEVVAVIGPPTDPPIIAVEPCGFTDECFETVTRPSTAFRKLPTCAGIPFMTYTTREIQ